MNPYWYLILLPLIELFVISSATGQPITGKITYSGSNAVVWSENECDGHRIRDVTLLVGRENGLKNVLVQVKNVPKRAYKSPDRPVIIDLRSCFLTPHVVAVRTGQPISIRHADVRSHRIQMLPTVNKAFSIDLVWSPHSQLTPVWKRLVAFPEVFDIPEPVFPMKCETHPYEEGVIVVLNHPFYFVTGSDGFFELDALPPGTYEIEAWHERLGTKSIRVTIDDDPVEVNFLF